MQSIISDNDKYIEESFQHYKSLYGDKSAEEWRARAATFPLAVLSFSLVGCVNYTIPFWGKIGQTAFVYSIYQACDKGRGDLCGFNMTKTGVVEGEDLIIQEPITGTFAK